MDKDLSDVNVSVRTLRNVLLYFFCEADGSVSYRQTMASMMIKNTNENVNEAITEAETAVVTAGPTAMIVTSTKFWILTERYIFVPKC